MEKRWKPNYFLFLIMMGYAILTTPLTFAQTTFEIINNNDPDSISLGISAPDDEAHVYLFLELIQVPFEYGWTPKYGWDLDDQNSEFSTYYYAFFDSKFNFINKFKDIETPFVDYPFPLWVFNLNELFKVPYSVGNDELAKGFYSFKAYFKDEIKNNKISNDSIITFNNDCNNRYDCPDLESNCLSTIERLESNPNPDFSEFVEYLKETCTFELNIDYVNGNITKFPDKSFYSYNDIITLTAFPDSGYTFAGWFQNDGNELEDDLSIEITMTEDISLSAKFTIKEYSLTFNEPIGGDVKKTPNKINYFHGEMVTLTPQPDKGYNFTGWSGDASGNSAPLTITMDQNKSISAQFAKKQYALTISDPNNGTITVEPDKDLYNYGETVYLTPQPNEGYNFITWTGDASGNTVPLPITMNQNKSISAQFAKKQYALTISDPNNGTITVEPDKDLYNYGETVTLTAKPDVGYHIKEWTNDTSGSSIETTITMTDDKTVSAIFEINQYTLTLGSNIPDAYEALYSNPDRSTFSHGEWVEIFVEPQPGYELAGWGGDVDEDPELEISIEMTSDMNVMAIFETSQYILEIDEPILGGNIEIDPVKPSYNYGETITLTAKPDVGYHIKEWTNDASGSSIETTITMTDDKTVSAIFEINQYTLTLGSNIPDAYEALYSNPDRSTFSHGEWVEIFVEPQPGYELAGWGGDVDEDPELEISIEMTSDMNVMAIFETSQYILEIDEPILGGNIEIDPVKPSYNYGETITLMAKPDVGYHIKEWTNDASGSSIETTITMTDDKTVSAIFEINQYTLTLGSNIPDAYEALYSNPDRSTFSHGEWVEIFVEPQPGYELAGWGGDVDEDPELEISIEMTSDMNVMAIFETSQYILEIDEPILGGNIEIDPVKPSYNYGETITLTAKPDVGYHIKEWTNDASGSSIETTITMTDDKTVSAIFEINQYTLTLGSNIPDAYEALYSNPDRSTFSHGEWVEIFVEPLAGYELAGWGGDVDEDPELEISIEMTSDMNIIANFFELQYTLEVYAPEDSIINIDPDKTYYSYGDSVTITATPSTIRYLIDPPDYYEIFYLDWNDHSQTITITNNMTITASYCQERNFDDCLDNVRKK